MSWTNLHHFWLLVKHGGPAPAAVVAGRSENAMSAAVSALERELGRPLVVRSAVKTKKKADHDGGVTIELTPDGAALYHDIAPAFETLVRALARLTNRGLAVTALPSLDPCLEVMVARFDDVNSNGVTRVVAPKDPRDLAGFVRSGQAEVGLTVHNTDLHAGLTEIDLWSEELVLVASPGTALPQDPVPLSSLGNAVFVTTPEGTSLRTLAEDALREAGVSMRIGHVTDSRPGLIKAVVEGKGVFALLNPGLAALAVRLGAERRTTHPPIPRDVVFVHGPQPPSGAAERFIQLGRRESVQPTLCGW